jgi:hypothetical protein
VVLIQQLLHSEPNFFGSFKAVAPVVLEAVEAVALQVSVDLAVSEAVIEVARIVLEEATLVEAGVVVVDNISIDSTSSCGWCSCEATLVKVS